MNMLYRSASDGKLELYMTADSLNSPVTYKCTPFVAIEKEIPLI